MRKIMVVLVFCAVWLAGCSSGNPATPVTQSERSVESSASHSCWGLWQFTADPEAGTLDVAMLRTGSMHLNALPFLEPPPLVNLTLESLQFNGNLVTAGIGLRHPFLGLDEFTGFDVCGIFITDGSVSGFEDSGIVMAGQGDTRLLNPDGYSRWWNPTEFPHGKTMFSYMDGLLGTPDAVADFNGTVNGYKYFCEDIENDDPVTGVDPSGRGVFRAGSKNTRIYELELGAGLVFNYAIDACWQFPTGGKPWAVPDDFGEAANRSEAWNIVVTETSNTLFNDGVDAGGELHLSIDVYDWFNPELNSVKVESPGNFASVISATPSGGGTGYSTYTIDITSAAPQAAGDMDILVSVISEEADFQGFINGTNTTAYFVHTTNVAGEIPEYIEVEIPNGGEDWPAGSSKEITWTSAGSTTDVMIEYSKDDFGTDIHEIIDSTPNDGSFMWDPVAFDPTITAKVRITDVDNPSIYDISDDYFSITTADTIYVDDSNTTGVEDGTMDHPYNTIQEGLAAASSGFFVLVDDSGGEYTGPITLVDGVYLKSQNWDPSDGGDEATISYGGTSAVVTGANAATIDGFKIDGTRYGIDCNATSPDIINCRVVNLRYSDCTGIWLRNGSMSHLDGVEVYDLNNNTSPGYATFWGIKIDNCDASGGNHVLIEHTVVHHVFSSDTMGLGGSYCYPHGMLINNSDGVVVRNSIVHDITGGNYHEVYGIRVADSNDVALVNTIIYDVDKTYYYGVAYGLNFTTCGNLDARNLIISHVHKGEGGTGGYYQTAYGVYQSGSSYYFEYCDVYDCQSGNYNNVTSGIGCITANPMYVTDGVDFHLQSGSPCIDKGDPDTSYNDTDGSRNDMGAYGGPEGDW